MDIKITVTEILEMDVNFTNIIYSVTVLCGKHRCDIKSIPDTILLRLGLIDNSF